MKKIFQSGLAFGLENGACQACNLNYSWLFDSSLNLLLVDKIVVTQSIWNVLMKKPKEIKKDDVFTEKGSEIRFQAIIKRVYEILQNVGLIEIIDGNKITENDSDIIYKQIEEDIDLLYGNKLIKTEDKHLYYIGKYGYCIPKLWTLYASLLFSRRTNYNFSIEDEDFIYLNTLLPLKLNNEVFVGRRYTAINQVLELFLPEINIWPTFLFEKKDRCQVCKNLKECNDTYLISMEKNLLNLLRHRERDEIIELGNVVERICDEKFKRAYEIAPLDVVRELNIEAVKIQHKLNKVYKNVNKCSKLIVTISSCISLGLLFKNPQVATIFGGVAAVTSHFSEQINKYYQEKYQWVNFINQHSNKL